MVLTPEPIAACVESVDPNHRAHRIFLTPAAAVLTQGHVRELAAKYDWILLLCGHYEGVDQRVIDLCFDECVSIGEYVLTGGEIPAMVVVDAVSRYVDGVISAASLENESFANPPQIDGTANTDWEHPQFTRPRVWRNLAVPQVLLGGHHGKIQKFRESRGGGKD
jgi:tRNA (guanine37-N1)-methyltransferase